MFCYEPHFTVHPSTISHFCCEPHFTVRPPTIKQYHFPPRKTNTLVTICYITFLDANTQEITTIILGKSPAFPSQIPCHVHHHHVMRLAHWPTMLISCLQCISNIFHTNTIHQINILVLLQYNTVLMQLFKHIDNYFVVHTTSQNSKIHIFGSRPDPHIGLIDLTFFQRFDCTYQQPVPNISNTHKNTNPTGFLPYP